MAVIIMYSRRRRDDNCQANFARLVAYPAVYCEHESCRECCHLHPNGKVTDTVPLKLEAAELSPFILGKLREAAEKASESKPVIDLDIPNVEKRTLRAIVNTLTEMQKLIERNKEFRFGPMKWMVKNSFPSVNPAKSQDLLHYLLAANLLEISQLLSPAAAWVELKKKEDSSKKNAQTAFPRELIKGIPADVSKLLAQYWKLFDEPLSNFRLDPKDPEFANELEKRGLKILNTFGVFSEVDDGKFLVSLDYPNPHLKKKALILYQDPESDHNNAFNWPNLEVLGAISVDHSIRFRRCVDTFIAIPLLLVL